MKKYRKVLSGVFILLVIVVALTSWYLNRHTVSVLEPAGPIAHKERNLIIFTVLISAVVVIPVFIMLFGFAWRYREGNKKAKYDPKLEGSAVAETVWWLIPALIILTISVVTWRSSYALDPFRSLASGGKPLTVQVVALDWKWLFIYPGQGVASVNQAVIPVGTPVDFEITSDSVMNSFWVPQLAGQMYAMPGMSTHLNLEASRAGDFRGVSANISGTGFAGMSFSVDAMSQTEFSQWLSLAKHAKHNLTSSEYAALAYPSSNVPPSYYASVQSGLYDTIVLKYMTTANGDGSGTVTKPAEVSL